VRLVEFSHGLLQFVNRSILGSVLLGVGLIAVDAGRRPALQFLGLRFLGGRQGGGGQENGQDAADPVRDRAIALRQSDGSGVVAVDMVRLLSGPGPEADVWVVTL
jgi:hypothetical protein